MILEIRRIDSASLQSLLEIFAAMKSLAAGRNLNSLKQQIKTICCPLRSSRSRVERAPRQRKTQHKYGRDTGFRLRKLTQLSLCLRVEIVG